MTGGSDRDAVRRLRAAFLTADYTVDGVREMLGPVAERALSREGVVPAERATRGGSQLEAMVRSLDHPRAADRPRTGGERPRCRHRFRRTGAAPVTRTGLTAADPAAFTRTKGRRAVR